MTASQSAQEWAGCWAVSLAAPRADSSENRWAAHLDALSVQRSAGRRVGTSTAQRAAKWAHLLAGPLVGNWDAWTAAHSAERLVEPKEHSKAG